MDVPKNLEATKTKRKRRTKLSKSKRKKMKDLRNFEEYSEFMNNNLSGDKTNNVQASHPLFYVENKVFRRIQNNTIIVKNPKICRDQRQHRIITYDISNVGKNLEMSRNKEGYAYVNLRRTKKNCLFIMISHSELASCCNLELMTVGERVPKP